MQPIWRSWRRWLRGQSLSGLGYSGHLEASGKPCREVWWQHPFHWQWLDTGSVEWLTLQGNWQQHLLLGLAGPYHRAELYTGCCANVKLLGSYFINRRVVSLSAQRHWRPWRCAWPVSVLVEVMSNSNGFHGLMCFDIILHYQQNKRLSIIPNSCLSPHTNPGKLTSSAVALGSGQPWVPHGDSTYQHMFKLLELHGLTGTGASWLLVPLAVLCAGSGSPLTHLSDMQKVRNLRNPWVSVQDVVLNSLEPSTLPSQPLPELSHFYTSTNQRKCLAHVAMVLVGVSRLDTKWCGVASQHLSANFTKAIKNTCPHKKSLHQDMVCLFK